MVLVQVPLAEQPPLLLAHSFTSTQALPCCTYPLSQVKPQVPVEQVAEP
jgi:hypothetical protein